MFASTSRYYSIETTATVTAQGRTIVYARRRFLPQGTDMPLLAEVTVIEGDRLDLIAARTLGDPEQFWRICDANNAMNPFDLTRENGRSLRIAIPQGQA